MKKLRILFLFAGALSLPLVSHAAIGQVNHLNAAGSSVICVPGASDQVIIIQNNGSNAVRLSLDGGAATIDLVTGKPGTNPTPTTGYLLAAGGQLIISTQQSISQATPGLHKPIVAIMVTGTTTLDIISDGTLTTFPTT
jgi:hypothetical protein